MPRLCQWRFRKPLPDIPNKYGAHGTNDHDPPPTFQQPVSGHQELCQQLAAAVDAGVAVQGLDVLVHGVAAEVQHGGNLLLAVAAKQELQSLALPGGKRTGNTRGRSGFCDSC